VTDGVRVETDGLNRFSGKVQDDTAKTLEAGYSRASVDLSTGVQFGANNVSGSVHAAKERYVQSLESSTQNVVEYLEAAKVLAAAATKVAAAFSSTDHRSGERLTEVHEALTTAVTESQQRRARVADGHPTTRGGGVRAV
jgi:hypothetical protein